MSTFKVICKATNGENWNRLPSISKIVNTSKFFGLLKSSKVVSHPDYVPGPTKDEICIVAGEYISVHDSEKYYYLSGYPYGGYNSKYFIRLDEFNETQKEIAQKPEPVFN